MGFMVRIILGLALVVTTCTLTHSASPWRYIRQVIPEEAPEVFLVSDVVTNLNESNKEEVSNDVINRTNIDDILRLEVDSKLKTENETEIQLKTLDNLNVNKETAENTTEDDSKYKPVNRTTDNNQSTTEKVPDFKDSVTVREQGARSMNINKYVSPEFHNKNNVYSLSISPDTEKFTNLHNDIFSTTSGYDFERKRDEIEMEVKHKLEYIDREFEQEERSFHKIKGQEEFNVSTVIDKLRDNDTDAELHYIKHKNITSSYNKDKNKINKETDIESGQVIDYNSAYNKTHVYNETPKDYKNQISAHDEEHVDTKLTHKLISEPTPTKTYSEGDNENLKEVLNHKDVSSFAKSSTINKTENQYHLFSNKIETDSTNDESGLKTKTNFLYTSTRLPIVPTSKTTLFYTSTLKNQEEKFGKENVIGLTKRGSTKYVDTVQPTTPVVPVTEFKEKLFDKQNYSLQEVVQENQVYPVQVLAPNIDRFTEKYYISNTTPNTAPLIIDLLTTSLDATTIDESSETTTLKSDSTILDITPTEQVKFTTNAQTEIETITAPITTESDKVTTIEDSSTVTTMESTDKTSSTETETPTTIEVNDNIPFVTKSAPDLIEEGNKIAKARVLNINNTEPQTNQSISIAITPTTSQLTIVATTTETVPTTSDYRDNIILKHTELETTTNHHNITIYHKHNYTETRGLNETKKKPTARLPVPTEAPLIIPLNISMYETELTEITTLSHFKEDPEENNSGKIAAIVISSIGAVCLVILAGLLFVMRKRHKRFNYGQRCTPVSLDAYSVDNVSVYNSMRRKAALRASKRSYGNPAFDDPTCTTNPQNFSALAKFANNRNAIATEFEEIPQVTAQTNELPEGCEIKNRYANVIPLPETRVPLTLLEGYPNSDYINANYVTGPKSTKNYYIACQAPLQNTVEDFWRMIWEQQSKVILMLTHLFENGSEKCVDYLPPSEVLDCHRLFGDFQITLKKREVKEKYVISILQLKNMVSNSWREVTHLWYLGWPEKGVPSEANSLIAFLIEARSYIKLLPPSENAMSNNNTHDPIENGSINNERGPIVVHCSPGTGRTGTVIACDIAIREFELTRQVDIPKTVYKIRRDRASSVQTKEQYAFIYNVITLYATKLTGGVLDSL